MEISLELQDIEDDVNEQTTSTARKVVSGLCRKYFFQQQ